MTISASEVAAYLKAYVESYRKEYARVTSPPPQGGGYPEIEVSPYLYSKELVCYLAKDGGAIADSTWQPSYRWEIAGGPALMVDFPQTRTPEEVTSLLKQEGLSGKHIGLYRIVSQDGIEDEIWTGLLPEPLSVAQEIAESDTKIEVRCYDLDCKSLVQRLTFGAFCKIIDIRLPDSRSDFWTPRIIRDLGFVTADREFKRFYHYLELFPHVDKAAWDVRSIRVRVHVDVRRDFASAISRGGEQGGFVEFARPEVEMNRFYDRVTALKKAIDDFENLLNEYPQAEESLFHNFLKEHPVLLDIYGEVISKPRFYYPKGESPLGKEYVEPDFIIKYPGNKYRLVELERPGKPLATTQGQPRSEVGQAAFQIAEWETYIKNHYELIKNDFPGISVHRSNMIVISRESEENFGPGRDTAKYMELVASQYSAEVCLYDDLLSRARQAYIRLAGLINPKWYG